MRSFQEGEEERASLASETRILEPTRLYEESAVCEKEAVVAWRHEEHPVQANPALLYAKQWRTIQQPMAQGQMSQPQFAPIVCSYLCQDHVHYSQEVTAASMMLVQDTFSQIHGHSSQSTSVLQ